MSSSYHQTNRNRARFYDDSQASSSSGDHRTYVPRMETTMTTYEGPHFPGLQSIFKHKLTAQTFNEEVDGKLRHETSHTVIHKEEDIDSEASEFIKRKHHAMDLQKLTSMKKVS